MTEVRTDTMAPNTALPDGSAPTPPTSTSTAGASDPTAKTPTPRKRRTRKKPDEAPPPSSTVYEPSDEELLDLGLLTLRARREGVQLEEYVEWCRTVIALHDKLLG